MLPQPGIFAVGAAAHCYLTFDIRPGVDACDFVLALSDVDNVGDSAGPVNQVVGFRPELWAEVAGDRAPLGVRGFDVPVRGPDGFEMPAAQHDGWIWLSGAGQDRVFDAAFALVAAVDRVASLVEEVVGWTYRGNRDLTGFIDGTENPVLPDATDVVLVPAGEPGSGGTVVLVQTWRHRSAAWRTLSQEDQEAVIGRHKTDSVELAAEAMPATSHVARTVVEVDGEEREIYRRNTSYGGVRETLHDVRRFLRRSSRATADARADGGHRRRGSGCADQIC